MLTSPPSPETPNPSLAQQAPTADECSGSKGRISSAGTILRKLKRHQHLDGPENPACKKLNFGKSDENIEHPTEDLNVEHRTEGQDVNMPNEDIVFEKMTLSDPILNSFDTGTLALNDDIFEGLSTGTMRLSDSFFKEFSTGTVEWTDDFLVDAFESTGQWETVESNGGSFSCRFPAIYNFGDSNSDTGGISAAISEILSPNGESFFGHPAGRACDGRLIIDFIAEDLKLPYLSAYLDSVGTNFRHGANFATGGSSIRPPGYSPFNLWVQISQFIQFKARTTAIYDRLSLDRRNYLPRPAEFSQALYTFDIGQNDLDHGFQYTTAKQVLASIPDIIGQLSQAMHMLYDEGARFFWVHNTGPVGCLPASVSYEKSNPWNLDKNGCVKVQNEVAMEFNRQLKDMISNLRSRHPFARITYVDVYSAKYALVSNAMNLGFVEPVDFCCGNCRNGKVYSNPCNHPSKHISWDGIHYSQVANMWVAERILNGSFSDPPFSIQNACQHQGTM